MQKLLVVLDLDEALVYGTRSLLNRPADFNCGPYFIYRRPGLDEFLSGLRGRFLVAIWTSSSASYATCVVNNIFPDSYPLEFVWAVDRCTRRFNSETGYWYSVKNLKKIKRKGYDLKRVVSIDDSSEKYESSYGNLIRIQEYLGDSDDNELLPLLNYLEWLNEQPNVRQIEKRIWRKDY